MSIKPVRNIVLAGLMSNTTLDNIVAEIKHAAPETHKDIGLREVKQYVCKLKKDGFLDADGFPTRMGSEAIAKFMFSTPKTSTPIDGSAPQKEVKVLAKEEQALEYFDYAISDKGDYKLRNASLKRACNILALPYHKKGRTKAQLIAQLHTQLAQNA